MNQKSQTTKRTKHELHWLKMYSLYTEFKEKFNISEEEILKQIGNKEMLKYDLEMNKVMDFLKEANK